MKTTTRTTPGFSRSLVVSIDGKDVGFVGRVRGSKTVTTPWQAWLLDGPEIDGSGHGSCETFLGSWFGCPPSMVSDGAPQTMLVASWPAARRAAIAAVVAAVEPAAAA